MVWGISEEVTFKPCLKEVKETPLERIRGEILGRRKHICEGPGAGRSLVVSEEQRGGLRVWSGVSQSQQMEREVGQGRRVGILFQVH